jgi:transposase
MHVVYTHYCGLDVHKKTITACLLVSEAGGKGQSEVRRFGTMTRDLLELADWLQSQQVTHVARVRLKVRGLNPTRRFALT